jgi:hypothetical protein
MTLKEVADKITRLHGRQMIDQSSAALAWRVAWEGRNVRLPDFIFEDVFTGCCLEYLSVPHGQKRVIMICEGVSVKADHFDFTTGQGGTWIAKTTQDGIADLLTMTFMFLS